MLAFPKKTREHRESKEIMHNPEDRRRALEMNKKLLEFCDELWVFWR
ncbi:hypothetical protein [Archaeoglobus sp.]